MSIRRLSPTANLLRNSRLFSLPPPLPRPSSDLTATSNFDSSTATTPYPTHAAIETTDSSLGRGDWGLKRPLPLKSTTKSSTPTIHIDNVDSIDHITDFDSAADHVLTLRKWQEIDMPVVLAGGRRKASGPGSPKSVFESQSDNTKSRGQQRWKFRGPWLAGKTEGEFQDYMEKIIKGKKLDFRKFLAERLTLVKAGALRRQATDSGDTVGGVRPDEVEVSEKELETYIRRLRNEEVTMHRLVEEYLDLPKVMEDEEVPDQSYGKHGPPMTHPSAGLSYLRTASHIVNHSMYGPQEFKPPLQGRVIAPKFVRGSRQDRALIGVAGVVARDNRMTMFKDARRENTPGVDRFEPDVSGGAKLWVTPSKATVNSRGRIDMVVDRATRHALSAITETTLDRSQLPEAALASAQDRAVPSLTSSQPRRPRNGTGYGLEDSGGGAASSSGRALPFIGPDDEIPGEMSNFLRAEERKLRKDI